MFSVYGRLVVAPGDFGTGELLELSNLVNQKVCVAVLVWRGLETAAGCEMGMRLMAPSADFWRSDT